MWKYQAILLDDPNVTVPVSSSLNPATLLPSLPEKDILHDYLKVLETAYSSWPDLSDKPLSEADWDLFTDGSRFVKEGQRYAGYMVATEQQVIEVSALPQSSRHLCTESRLL